MKPKCVTIQMKALDEYFLMVVFMLLLNRVHVFTICMLNLDREICHRVKLCRSYYFYQEWQDNNLQK